MTVTKDPIDAETATDKVVAWLEGNLGGTVTDTARYDEALVTLFHKRNLRAQMLLGPAGSAMARHLRIQTFSD